MDDRLYRSVEDRMLAGVAGGVAERLDADPSIIRVVWALLIVVTGGLALIAYVVMWIVVPEAPDAPDAAAVPGVPGGGTMASDGATPPTAGATAPDPDAPTAATDPGAVGAWVAPDGTTVARSTGSTRRRRQRGGGGRADDRGPLIGGLVLIVIGGFFLLRQFIPAIDLGSWWPLILVAIGLILVIVSVRPDRTAR